MDVARTSVGLTSAEAVAKLESIGPNAISSKRLSKLKVLFRQFKSPILVILLSAALISGVLGEVGNAIEISVIVLLSVSLSFFTEYRAEKATADLHSRISHSANVIRDGQPTLVNVLDLVPADVVILGVGSIIPADLELLSSNELQCDESIITGESIPSQKNAGDTCLMGTVVKSGSATGLVKLTGARTEFGRIATKLGSQVPETDFQKGLANFSIFLLRIALVTTVLVMLVNFLFKPETYNFTSPSNVINLVLYALALAVGMTPQLLPAIVSTALAIGSRRLAKEGVLVKRLVSIEDFGDIDVLVTDKTGTLTLGTVSFERAIAFGDLDVLRLGILATDADYDSAKKSKVGLNTLDAALWDKATFEITEKKLDSIPFDHDRRISSVLLDSGLLIAKGSPEDIFGRCIEVTTEAKNQLQELYSKGSRVIAVATKNHAGSPSISAVDESDLDLQGLLVFSDAIKPDISESIQSIRSLGIEIKIATGDSAEVAVAVCNQVGLEVTGVLTGNDLETLNDEELIDKVSSTSIFARVSPEQKARILQSLRKSGKSIGFLGDGVNDALALHDADVGISVDTAADVAKDAADVVLLEKDLAVLAQGIATGRKVFNNTMKYVLMGTAGDFGNLFSAALGTMVLPFLPLTPGQVLLQDLMYDSSQLSIPTDNVDQEQVARPSHWKIGFIRKYMLVFGLASSIFDFLTFGLMLYVFHAQEAEFHTGWFVESLATATLIGFSIRTRRMPFFRSRPSLGMIASISFIVLLGSYLPYSPLSDYLGFTPLPPLFFLALSFMVIAYITLAEIAKRKLFVGDSAMPSSVKTTEHKSFQRRAAKFRSH